MKMIPVVLCLLLTGCLVGADLPQPDQLTVTAPPGASLPLRGRVLLVVTQSDKDRLLSYEINRVSREETKIHEGEAMERAALALFGKAFAHGAANRPDIRPHIIARISGKATWNRMDSTYKIMCAIDANTSEGYPIGSFIKSYQSPSVLNLDSSLSPAYGQCLKLALDDMLQAPGLTQMIQAGFPEPDPEKTAGYLRSQGFVIR